MGSRHALYWTQNGDILRVGGSSAPHPVSIYIMPIRSLLSETSFNTDQTEMIVKAFDDAWAQVQIDEAEPAMVVSQVWTIAQ